MKAKPTNAAQRLVELGTNAKSEGKDRVAEMIFNVKAGTDPDQQLRSLKGKKEELVSTYAYLINKDEKDKEVTCLKPDGLKLMIIHRLNTLMPIECGKCLKDYCQEREENSKVICLRCDQPACPECYPDLLGHDNLVYLCQPCRKVVKNDLGVNRLEEKHFLKASLRKKEVINLTEENEDYEEEEDDEEDDDQATQDDRKREEAEGIENAYVPAGWKEKVPKKKDGKPEKVDENPTTKVCIHHKRGRCKFGLSGKKKIDGEWKKCPFAHPRVCEKLLTNGDRGRFGCRGNCGKFHPKMCFSSMNSKKCPHGKECRNGYHVRGTMNTEATGIEKENAFLKAGRQDKSESKMPTGQQNEGPFFDLGQKVRQEILQVFKELNLSATPTPPPQPKAVTKEELKEALMALLQ